MQEFLNLCATTIQKTWRGQTYRKKELPLLRKERRAEEIFIAFIRAWKLRKVM
jgi:hypothetical protein